ncbi:Ig-like domain-containing protein [Enterobacter cloacae]|uniref:Ig-like domain-containing protein n=1 Tax=Enterobacter cloacae complex TaxID=354276 RepID=UPI00210E5475|nr:MULTISPECIES: Ig-like domain-containing protein [Enterobacter cloacae complex]MCQ4447263.1 Ig-like domain-containing protein [Enterobacter cloacae]MDW2867725.1 Ig-like domain-containing protein [Enterobacter hormaechei]
MKKTIASNANTEPNIAAMATLPPLPTNVLLWNDYQFPREIYNGDLSEDNTPTISGKGEPGMTAVIDLGGGKSVSVPVNAEGNWTWTPAPALADGSYTWSVALEDAQGNRGPSTTPVSFIIDTVGNAVSISHAEDNTGPLTNPLASGSSTDDVNPVIVGTATPGSLVTLYVDGKAVGSMTADPSTGAWAIEISPALESGKTYEITAGEYSGPGENPAPTRPFLLTVDTVVPTGSLDRIEDNVGRYQGDVANPGMTDDTTPTLHGTGRPGDIVFIRDGGDVIGSTTVGNDNSWEYTLPEQTNGTALDVSVVFRGPTGVESAPTAPWKLVIDTEAPTKPEIGDVEDDQGPVVGPIHNGDVTDDTQPVFSGEGAVPGDIVELIIDDEVVGSATVGDDGKWEVTPENPLKDGDHEAVVVIVDPVGNASEPSDPIGFIVDTQPPAKPTIDTVYDDAGQQTGNIANGGITDDSTPDFTGTAEKDSLVFIIVNGKTVDSVTADSTGTWTWTPSLGLANGHYDVTVVAQDKAGLRSEPSDAFSFDLLAGGIPTAPAITDVIDDVEAHVGTIQNGGITNDARPTITGTAQDGTTVYLYDGTNPNPIGSAVVTGGRWTIDFDTDLAQGEHRFRAVAEDMTGNRGPETGEWVIIVDSVDPLAPTDIELWDDFGTPGLIANGDTTDDNTPTYRGKGEANGTAIIDLGNGTTVRVPVDDKGNWSYTPAPALADGDYTWKVAIEDKAGNVGPESAPIHFTVDTSHNGVSISHVVDDQGDITGNLGSGSHTDDTTPTVVGRASAGALVKIYVDGKYIDSVHADAITGAWQYTISPALTADATYKITASEDAGAGESAQTAPFELTLDTRVPTGSLDRVADDVGLVQGDLANPAVTDDTTPTLHGKGVAGDVVFIYDGTRLIDSVTVGPANTWNFTLPQQNNGAELSLTAVFQSPTGVKSAPTAPWKLTIDTEAPDAPAITGMYDDAGKLIVDGTRSADATPELRGTAEKNSLVKIYMPGSSVPIASVTADASGNWSWTSPKLSDASHNFYVKAQDAAGNVSGESNHYGLVVDTHSATPVILGTYDDVEGGIYKGLVPNGGLTNDANLELRGTAEANSIVYIYNAYNNAVLDTVKADANGNWSWERAVANTAAGKPHMFYTIAKDDLGNVSAKSETYSINVDTVNNAPVITGSWDDVQGGVYNGLVGNGGVTNDRTLDLRGTAEPGSVVYIVIDNYGTVSGSVTAGADGKWSYPVTTNYNMTYNFHAYSVDVAGNRSANSAQFAITVDTVNNAPVITGSWDDVQGGVYNGLVGNGGVTNDRTLDLRGTAEAGSVVYIIDPADGVAYGSVTAGANGQWSFPLTTNYNKTYNFKAYSVDVAGNRSANSTNFAITVDTVVAAPTVTVITDNVAGGKVGNLVDGERTNDNRPTITGNGAEAGAKIEIVLALGNQGWSNNNLVYTTTAKADGSWSLEIPKALSDGTWYFRAKQTDIAGNTSALGNQHYVVVDTVAAAPTITVISDNVAGGKVGNLVDGERTNDNRPTITGNGAEAGAKIEIVLALGNQGWSNNNLVYTTTAKADGSWSLEIPKALSDGTWYFRAKQTDIAGNTSALGNQHYVVVDTVNAAPTITSVMDNVGNETGNVANLGKTDDNTPTLNGTAEAGSTVYIAVNGATYSTVATNGNWSFTPPALPLGNHTFSVFSIDPAGNKSTGISRSLTVVAPKTSGFENFDSYPIEMINKGTFTSKNGLKLTLNDTYYPGYGGSMTHTDAYGGRALVPFGNMTMHFDGVNAVSMKLSGANDPTQSSVVKSTYVVYDTAGQVISSGLLPSGNATFSATAPAGREIGDIVFNMGRGASSGLSGGGNTINTDQYSIDDVRWTVNTSRSASRSMMMSTEEQHDDNTHLVSTLNDREINLDSLQHKTIDITNGKQDKLNISLHDVLTHAEKDMFIADGNKQLMVQGDKGDVLNLNDLLPDNTDPGNWTNAGNVKVSGVEYQVYHMENHDVELLVQNGVTVNVNNH